ncbi:hypothetical protein [Butyrivibrio sp. INlla16]|uniref:hypothetical protein n=1 Tax=Butyrivibrio sp. INlla16 TaxID=1520807 RepID=UPI000890F796|nr:hypothetical protein [Butyrivibrio sp. INlla16]SDB52984.1 hypothetical protein SAMN02910263_02672 [Butyrivibrio sp. INlla16]
MKQTKEEAFAEVMKRGRNLKRQNAKGAATVISICASCIMAALVLAIGWFGGAGYNVNGQSAYGSFLLSHEAGGYVLVAAVAFVVGVGITVWILKYRKNREK